MLGQEKKHRSYLWLSWISSREGKPVASLFHGKEQFIFCPEMTKCLRVDGSIRHNKTGKSFPLPH